MWSKIVDRAQKEAVVAELDQIFTVSGVVIVAHYTGITVSEMSDLRLRMRKVGGAVRVAKNKLVKIALEGKECQSMAPLFSGQTALIYSEDQVAAAKVAVEFAKDNQKLTILGGSMGATSLDASAVVEVSKMPSKDELVGTIASMLIAPASNLAGALSGPSADIAGVFSTIEEKAA
jgi:large subunit ribosomal protein L10